MEKQKIFRIIDANLNRSREGLRVCEDITRFLLNDKEASRKLKLIRQSIFYAISAKGAKSLKLYYLDILKERDSVGDVGKTTTKNEAKRDNWQSIFLANIERAKESVRVLEEAFKIIDEKVAQKFKKIRFKIYDAEKTIIIKHKSLSDSKHNRLQRS